MEYALLIGAVLAVLFGARALRVRRVERILARPLADAPAGMVGADDALVGLPAGATVLAAVVHLSRIDSRVLDAIDRGPRAEVFASYGALAQHVEEMLAPGGAAEEGVLAQFEDHAGEWLLAEELRDAGHHVEMADAGQHAAWNARVDGTPVQLEVGLEARDITEQLATHPAVPVITVGEHAKKFADWESVSAILGVSGAAIGEITASRLDSILGLDRLGRVFPLAPGIVGGASNLRLAATERDEETTAGRKTVTDVAAVGGGGWVGAKVGALCGSPLGPAGIAVGGVVGGMLGAIGGRAVSTRIKERELSKAEAARAGWLAAYPRAYADALERKAEALERHADELDRRGRRVWWWPRVGGRAGQRIASLVRRRAKRCCEECRKLRRRIEHDEVTDADKVCLALEILGTDGGERAFSRDLQRITNGLEKAAADIRRELARLGRLASDASPG